MDQKSRRWHAAFNAWFVGPALQPAFAGQSFQTFRSHSPFTFSTWRVSRSAEDFKRFQLWTAEALPGLPSFVILMQGCSGRNTFTTLDLPIRSRSETRPRPSWLGRKPCLKWRQTAAFGSTTHNHLCGHACPSGEPGMVPRQAWSRVLAG